MLNRPKPIDDLINFEIERGNSLVIVDTGWSKMFEVYMMKKPISNSGRSYAKSIPDLEETIRVGSSHHRAGRIYSYKKLAVDFPK